MKARYTLWLGLLATLSMTAHAQSVTPDQEYKKLIQVDQNIQPLGEHPFGENVSLYDGTLSFNVTDVTLRGNGPTITVGRTLQFWQWADQGAIGPQRPLGDWDLDIPRIETLTGTGANTASSAIWQTGGFPLATQATTQRCSNFKQPPGIKSELADTGWAPDEWWYGYNLLVPGEGKQLLMPRSAANSLSPAISGMSFSIVTKNNWMIGCGVPADDGGEGFLAIAPDGTRYTFAHLVYRPYSEMTKSVGSPFPLDTVSSPTSGTNSAQSVTPMQAPGGVGILSRQDAFMYVTQIQDRFGNTLTYNYDPSTGYLSSITANDGREVDVTYVPGTPLIQTITTKATNVASRTWTYSYNAPTAALPSLAGVQLPDGTAWSYQLPFETLMPITQDGNCQTKAVPSIALPVSTEFTGTITAPSGLTGKFNVGLKLSGRSYVPQDCYGNSTVANAASFFPEWSAQFSIVSEVLSGAGMPTETWNYSYSPANESWNSDPCATSGTCATTVYTDVTDPNGNDTRYTFSNRFDATEGLLQETDYYSGAASGTLMRSEVNTYANPTGGPWPTAYGSDLLQRDNQSQVTELAPLAQKVINDVPNGDAYTWLAEAFNAYAQVTKTKRYNSISYEPSIEEQMSYVNDTAYWVLGLPQEVDNLSTGETESLNTYTAIDTLLTRSRFGELLMTYGFNTAGQLSSFTDGDTNQTTLGNYYRGIPQQINYPDKTSESLTVDDLGQIRSITDQNSNTTSYGYDTGGRVNSVVYPTGDTVSWNSESITTVPISGTEQGIAGLHWRRTSQTGNYQEITYYDAMLRPLLVDSSVIGTSNSDITTAKTYDFAGRTLLSSYPVAGSVSWPSVTKGITTQYDALGRVLKTLQDSELGAPLTTSTQYSYGARKLVTDPNNNLTTTAYLAFDEPSYDTAIEVIAPTGITQNIYRDLYGNPTAIIQSGSYNGVTNSVTKNLYYDSYHRLCRTVEPESGSEITTYDAANNVQTTATGLSISGAGCGTAPTASQTSYTYDPMNRVWTISPPSPTQGTVYTYDGVGNVKTSISGTAIQGYPRNKRNMLTGENLWLPNSNLTWSLNYTYDGNGHLSTVGYPNGEVVSYAPDARGQATQAGAYAHAASYFPNGELSSFVYGNGVGYAAELNDRQILGNFSYGTANTLNLSEDLVYDPNGNITNVNDLANGPRTKTFGYDALNRLTSAQASGLSVNESYSYDALNNLRTRLTQGSLFNLNYDTNNRLNTLTVGTGTFATYTYDAFGNRQSVNSGSATTSYVFDTKNQLLQIPGVETYTYDASGRRITKTPTGGSPTYSFYSQAGELMFAYAPGNAQGTDYIYLGKKLIARNDIEILGAPGPISFDANPNNGSYTVTWGATPKATSYVLQENPNSTGWTTVSAGSGTSTSFSGKQGGSYVYQVQGCDGSTCGGWTTSATLGVRPAIVGSLTVPSGIVYQPYTVSWPASVGATSYTVQQSINGGAWTTLATSAATQFQITSTNAGGTYTYQVAANNTYGNRGWSATSAGVTVAPAPPTPTSFVVPSAASLSDNPVLTWNPVAYTSSYVLTYTATAGDFKGPSSATLTYVIGTTGWGVPIPVGTYTFTLSACNISGCSPVASGGPMVLGQPTIQPEVMPLPSGGCTATSCRVSVGTNVVGTSP